MLRIKPATDIKISCAINNKIPSTGGVWNHCGSCFSSSLSFLPKLDCIHPESFWFCNKNYSDSFFGREPSLCSLKHVLFIILPPIKLRQQFYTSSTSPPPVRWGSCEWPLTQPLEIDFFPKGWAFPKAKRRTAGHSKQCRMGRGVKKLKTSPAGQCRHQYGKVSSYGLLTKDYSTKKKKKAGRKQLNWLFWREMCCAAFSHSKNP